MRYVSRLVLFWAIAMAMAAAQGRQQFATLSEPLEPQPLAQALEAWARQTGVQIIYGSELTRGQSSRAVAAGLSADKALEQLLDGSDLIFQWLNDRTVSILGSSADGSSMPTAEAGSLLALRPVADRAALGDESQSVDAPAADDEQAHAEHASDNVPNRVELEEVLVTGSHIRGVATPSPIIEIDRSSFFSAADTTVADALSHLPQNFGGGANPLPQGSPGREQQFNSGSGSSLNLRGLGSDATLVLLNGRRTAASGFGVFVDLSLIPLSAVDRIEIVPDGASAIYGSDAVGGVANIVLRKKVDGFDTSLKYGSATEGSYDQIQASQLFGTNWQSGRVLASFEFLQSQNLAAADRSFSVENAPADLVPFQKRSSAFLALSQSIAENLELELTGVFADKDVDRKANPEIFGTIASAVNVQQSDLSGTLTWRLSPSWDASITPYFSRNNLRSRSSLVGDIFFESNGDYSQEGVDLIFDGRLIHLPHGPLKGALGASFRSEALETSRAGFVSTRDRHSRDNYAAFSELQIPILPSLALNAAVRYEHYSDFGDTTNPKLGVLWAPSKTVKFRATYGTSFRAPHFVDLFGTERNATAFDPSAFGVPDPGSPNGSSLVIAVQGSNPNLRPERATHWNLGVDWEPQIINDLTISANWFYVDYKSQIDVPASLLLAPLVDPQFASLVTRDPSSALVDEVLAIPQFFNVYGPFDPSDVDVIVDNTVQNSGRLKVSGIDFHARKTFDLADWRLASSVALSYLDRYERQVVPSAPNVSILDRIFYPVKWRARAELSASLQRFTSSLFVNFVGDYTNDTLIPTQTVASWTTVDASVQYRLGRAGDPDGGTVLSLAAINLFNRNPPFITSPQLTDPVHYDGTNANPMRRLLSLTVQHKW